MISFRINKKKGFVLWFLDFSSIPIKTKLAITEKKN